MKEDKKGLENFLNLHLQEGEIPFEEADWNAMEQKLNEFDSLAGVKGFTWKDYLLLGAGALLIFLAGWFANDFYPGADVENREMLTNEQMLQDSKVSDPENKVSDPDHEVSASIGVDSEADIKSNSNVTSSGETSISKNDVVNKPIADAGNADPSGTGESGSIAADIQDGKMPSGQVSPRTAVPAADNNPAPQAVKNETARKTQKNSNADDKSGNRLAEDPITTQQRPAGENQFILNPIEYLNPQYSAVLPIFEIRTTEISNIDVIGPKRINEDGESVPEANQGRWSAGLTIAPDLNGVGPVSNYKLAWETGVSAYYSLAPHWRVSTGIFYAKKAYLASGADYTPPEGYWDYNTNGMIPDEVDALCGILDIPVNITYIWNPDSKFRILTSTGISSYIVLNEAYDYYFPYAYQDYNGWSTDENSTAFFGMLNAGAGVEWRVRDGLFLSAEPYFKIPLKEIGFGNVSLNGAALFFTIRKQFNPKQK